MKFMSVSGKLRIRDGNGSDYGSNLDGAYNSTNLRPLFLGKGLVIIKTGRFFIVHITNALN